MIDPSQDRSNVSIAERLVTFAEIPSAEANRSTQRPSTTKATGVSATVIGTNQGNPSQRNRPSQTEVTSNNRPIDLISREAVASEVRTKFNDIFEVNENSRVCANFEHISLGTYQMK